MTISHKKEALLLFLGDIFFFFLSLWIALLLRGAPFSSQLVLEHFQPFAILFVLWLIVFYIAGLYDKHTLILKSRLPLVIFNSQVVNSGIAVLFFYLFPGFGITPKTILALYLVISFILISLWRIYGGEFVVEGDRQSALLIGSGQEMRELFNRVNSEQRYTIQFVSSIDLNDLSGLDIQEEIVRRVYSEGIKFIAVDFLHKEVAPLLPHLYNLIFSKVQFIDAHKIYEDVFNRIPLSLINESWFLENVSVSPKFTYDFLKRAMDTIIAVPLTLVSFIMYPFICIALKIEDGGEIFSFQKRIGQNNRIIELTKFRTMSFNDQGDWREKGRENKVTKVGAFLRKTRLDEFPQLLNVISGDISLIGPRPEFPEPVKVYTEQIPYYNIRHIIKPGLSGWAQIYHDNHPHHAIGIEETKEKLSYDLFYIKNRSFLLDLRIALKTIKKLVVPSGV